MPNIAALANKGVVFEQHYSQPTCSHSRSALLTGRYASRTGFQFIPQNSLEPVGLPTDFPLMPGLLQELGYEAHGLGKWHLGYCSPEYLPNNRVFTSYNGLWNGAGDHLLHFMGANFTDVQGSLGFDFHLNDRIQLGAAGRWSTDIFVDRVADLLAARAGLDQPLQGAVHVENEDQDKPLMLYLAYQEPHAPLMVDPKYEALYPDEDNPQRKTYLGMVSSVDDSVGRIVQLLKNYTYTDVGGAVRSMYDDTVFLFSSDNGGMSEGLGYAGGDNSPLRGRKGDMWEGGCRVPAFITGPHINATGVSSALVHLTDWLPTLYRLGGGDVRDLGDIDGIDQLPVIRGEVEPLREEIFYDIANFENRNLTINVPSTWPNSTLELSGSFGAALRIGDFKLLVAQPLSGAPQTTTLPMAATHPKIESSYLTCLWTLGSKKIFLTKCLNLCRLCRKDSRSILTVLWHLSTCLRTEQACPQITSRQDNSSLAGVKLKLVQRLRLRTGLP